jgi:hypothetical protein
VPAASFAHVLDRLIDAGPGSSATAATAGILTAPLSGTPRYGVQPRWVAVRAPRPRRALTPQQRAALDTLRRHGARLSDDFDRPQLKSAFRELARGLHPDMHPHASGDERRWLASAFRDAREAYLALLT